MSKQLNVPYVVFQSQIDLNAASSFNYLEDGTAASSNYLEDRRAASFNYLEDRRAASFNYLEDRVIQSKAQAHKPTQDQPVRLIFLSIHLSRYLTKYLFIFLSSNYLYS